jgi:hypothetical protein
MAIVSFRSLAVIAALSAGAGLALSGAADAQSRSSRERSNPRVVARCMQQTQEALPGSYMSPGVSEQRAAMYQACVRNGGNIPGRR